MKSLIRLVWACAAIRVLAASPEAHVYLFPETTQSDTKPPSISPNDARLLFAQRLGVSEYHSLGDLDGPTLQLLNSHGGSQSPLFSNQPDCPRRLLFIVEGVEHPEEIMDPRSWKPAFKILDPPSSSANLQLINDLLRQDEHRRESDVPSTWVDVCKQDLGNDGIIRGGISGGYGVCNGKYKTSGCKLDSLPTHLDKGWEGHQKFTASLSDLLLQIRAKNYDETIAIQLTTPEVLRAKQADKETSDFIIHDLEHVLNLIAHLTTYGSSLKATLVLMPPSSKTSKSTPSPYGTYTLPSQLSRRAQPQTEEPLSALNPPNPASASSPPSPPETLATSTSPVTGVLPVCHSSLKSASSATHNCSGHGTPYLKYQTKSSSESDKMLDCWACKCSPSVSKDKDGKVKTVYWGGPACQKKDISVQFWLLAVLGIGLAATTSWGVGLLYSIGDEELPSVIGAGVAGPRAQK